MDKFEYDPPHEHSVPDDLSREGQQIVAGAEQMLRGLDEPPVVNNQSSIRKIGLKVLEVMSNYQMFYSPGMNELNYRRRHNRI